MPSDGGAAARQGSLHQHHHPDSEADGADGDEDAFYTADGVGNDEEDADDEGEEDGEDVEHFGDRRHAFEALEPHDEHEDGKEQDGDAEDEDDYIGSERRDYDERDAYEQLDDAHDPVFVEELEETEDGGDDADGHHGDGGDAGFQPDEEHAHDDEEQAQHDAVVSHLGGGLDLFCHYITSIYAAAMRRFFV